MPKKQKDGRYRAKITVGTDANGDKVYKWASGKTTRELEEAKAQIRAQYINGQSVKSDVLFGAYCVSWYNDIKKPSLALSTQRNYKTILNHHILPAFGERQLRAITASNLKSYMQGLAGRSKSTIALASAILYNVFTAAFADGIIPRNPAAGLPTPAAAQSKRRRALTDQETDKYVTCLSRHRYALLAAVYYYTGVRRGEGLGIQMGDIDFGARLIHIQRDIDYVANGIGELKNEQSERYMPIPGPLLQLLLPLRGTLAPTDFIFHDPDDGPGVFLSRSKFNRMWLRFMIDAGIAVRKPNADESRHPHDICSVWSPVLTTHYLRHNYATLLYLGNVDKIYAMRLLGHSNYQTTVNVYTHIRNELMQRPRYRIDYIFTADQQPDGDQCLATARQPLSAHEAHPLPALPPSASLNA